MKDMTLRHFILMLISFLSTPQFLFSFSLQTSYHFTDRNITSHFFDRNIDNFFVIEIPKDKNVYKVDTATIKKIFAEKNVTIADKNPYIVFVKNGLFDITILKEHIYKMYRDGYSKYNINIENISLSAISSIDFVEPYIISINFGESLLLRDSGTFSVDLEDRGVKKRVFFKFKLKAKIDVLKATRDIRSGEKVSNSDFEVVSVNFKEIKENPVAKGWPGSFVTTAYLKKGRILSNRHIKHSKSIQKGDVLSILLREGGFEMRFSAEALEAGDIGETIKAKSTQDKILEVIITDIGRGEVR